MLDLVVQPRLLLEVMLRGLVLLDLGVVLLSQALAFLVLKLVLQDQRLAVLILIVAGLFRFIHPAQQNLEIHENIL